jgi:hypothetical protein
MKGQNNKKDMNFLFFSLAIVILVLSIAGFGITVYKVNEIKKTLTGYASSGSGFVNLTILSSVSINVSNFSIDWGGGIVNYPSSNNATLFTNGSYSAGNVSGGNWSGTNVRGFAIDNIGNVLASINLTSAKNAADLFASRSSTHQAYKWNLSSAETNACQNISYTWHNNIWSDVVKSGSSPYKGCSHFNYSSGANTMNLDIYLQVPYDAANIGALSDTITISATATS